MAAYTVLILVATFIGHLSGSAAAARGQGPEHSSRASCS